MDPRAFLPALLLAFLPWVASAQMLGNLNEYPKLYINLAYQAPSGRDNESMDVDWKTQPDGTLKVTGSVRPSPNAPKPVPPAEGARENPSRTIDLPMTVAAPIFNEARSVTSAFRIPPPRDPKYSPNNELLTLSISHSDLQVGLDLHFTRLDAAGWNAACAFWNHLRALMPSPNKELIRELH